MNKFILGFVSVILINGVILTSLAVAKEPNDSRITVEVEKLLLQEPDIDSKKITVTTNNGVVILEGNVQTRLQADRIIELANSVDDIKHVDASKLKTATTNQYIKDAFITSAAKGKIIKLIRNGKIGKNSTFHVETTNGSVHIFGSAENKQDIDTLIKEVRLINGVKEVHHNITT